MWNELIISYTHETKVENIKKMGIYILPLLIFIHIFFRYFKFLFPFNSLTYKDNDYFMTETPVSD